MLQEPTSNVSRAALEEAPSDSNSLDDDADDFDSRNQAVQIILAPAVAALSDLEANTEAEIEPEPDADNATQSDPNEAGCCPICLEAWTSGGRHRLCSLRCGHLFGRSCVDKWLASGKTKCPQCNAPAKRNDIRILYCKRLVALDTAERDRLEEALDTERRERMRLEDAVAKANLAGQLLRAELEQMRSELNRQSRRGLHDSDAAREISSTAPVSLFSSARPHGFLRRVVLGSPSTSYQCRCVAFDAHFGIFLVSRSDPGSHGVVKISLWDQAQSAEFVSLHDDVVRGIAPSPHADGLFLTVGADQRLRLTSLSSNSVVQTWHLDSPAWCCVFDPRDRNLVYVGLSGGRVAVYDLRHPSTSEGPIHVFVMPLRRPTLPIHSLHCWRREGRVFLVGGSMDGPFVADITPDVDSNAGDAEDGTLVFGLKAFWTSNFGYQGVACSSVALDAAKGTLLASFRSLAGREDSRHVFCTLVGTAIADELAVAEASGLVHLPFVEFRSPGSHRFPSKSAIFPSQAREDAVFSALVADETTSAGHLFAVERTAAGARLQPVEVLATNAGSPVVECVWGVMRRALGDGNDGEFRSTKRLHSHADESDLSSCVGLLTEKHFYIYTLQL